MTSRQLTCANLAHPPEHSSLQFTSTPAAQSGRTSQPAAMAAERYWEAARTSALLAAEGNMDLSQGQPKGTLNVGAQCMMTLSEKADLENVSPAASVTKREAGSKYAAPMDARTSAKSVARDGAIAEQRITAAASHSAGNACIAHSSIGDLDNKSRSWIIRSECSGTAQLAGPKLSTSAQLYAGMTDIQHATEKECTAGLRVDLL